MSWQRCPVCLEAESCSVCNGTKLIDTITGLPPQPLNKATRPQLESLPKTDDQIPAFEDDLTPEENLFYSSPYFDTLMADKAKRQEAQDGN